MVHDPVTADLNRYLNKLDREDARAQAIEEIIDDWLTDQSKIKEALEKLELDPELHDEAVEVIMSGEYDRLGGGFVNYVRWALYESAAKELDRRIEQSLEDEAETEALWKEAFDE